MFIKLNSNAVVYVSGVTVEDNGVDAEVIADLKNRITETQKDIEVSVFY